MEMIVIAALLTSLAVAAIRYGLGSPAGNNGRSHDW
jgi:hypothetical protein